MWTLEKKKQNKNAKQKTLINTKNKLVVAREERGKGISEIGKGD